MKTRPYQRSYTAHSLAMCLLVTLLSLLLPGCGGGSGVARYGAPVVPVLPVVKPPPVVTPPPVGGAKSTSLTLALDHSSQSAGQPLNISAQLISGGTYIVGKTITFTFAGNVAGTAVTNMIGVATVTYKIPGTATSQADTITGTFSGDVGYTASQASTTVTVTAPVAAQTAISLGLDKPTAHAGDVVTFTALLSVGGTSLQGKSIIFSIGANIIGTVTTDINGKAVLAYTLPAGMTAQTYPANSSFPGDAGYSTSKASTSLTVNSLAKDTAMSISVSKASALPGDTITLTAVLTSAGNPVAGKTVAFTSSQNAIGSTTTDASGKAAITYAISPNTAAQTLAIGGSFVGDAQFSAARAGTSITIVLPGGPPALPPTNLSLVVDKSTAHIGESVVLTAALNHDAIVPIPGETLTFSIGSTVIGTATTDANGKATVTYLLTDSLTVQTYNLTVAFAGDASYTSSQASKSVVVLARIRSATSLTVALDVPTAHNGDTVNFIAVLTSGGSPVAGKSVTFNLATFTAGSVATDSNGKATLAYVIPDSLVPQTYTASAAFATDVAYISSQASTSIVVIAPVPQSTSMGVSLDKSTVKSSDTVKMTAALTVLGKPVAGRSVAFTIGTTAANTVAVGNAITDANGNAAYSYPVPASLGNGAFNVIGAFGGDIHYTASKASSTLNIGTTSMTLALDNSSVKLGSVLNMTAVLRLGSTPVQGKTVAFTIGTATAGSAVTDATGTATLAYTVPTSLAAQSYTVTGSFGGDTVYLASQATAPVMLIGSAMTLNLDKGTAHLGDTVNMTAVLTVGGTPAVGKTVAFTIGAVAAGTAVTDSNGNAALAYTVPASLLPATYSVTAAFVGDASYSAAKASSPLVITGSVLQLTLDKTTAHHGDTVNATAVLTDGVAPLAGKSVTISAGGTPLLTGTTDSTGNLSAAYTVTSTQLAGSVPFTAIFAGDATSSPASATAKLTVAVTYAVLLNPTSTTLKLGTGQNFTVAATVTDELGVPQVGVTVCANGQVGSSNPGGGLGTGQFTASGSAVCDSTGTATISVHETLTGIATIRKTSYNVYFNVGASLNSGPNKFVLTFN